MLPPVSLRVRPRHLWRRLAACALFALQAVVAVSPVAERGRDTARPLTHIERQGATHPRTHNEDTCALCAVRLLPATVTDKPGPMVVDERHDGLRSLETLAAPASAGSPTNLSRAPPAVD